MPKPIIPKLVSGTLYAHLFENQNTGLARNLFWNFSFDFAPQKIEGETMAPGALVEWLTPGCRDWRALVGRTFDSRTDPDAEASFYIGVHEWADAFAVTVEGLEGHRFRVRLMMRLNSADVGEISVDARTWVTFEGVRLVSANFSPSPTLLEAKTLLAPFFDASTLGSPRQDGHALVIPPA